MTSIIYIFRILNIDYFNYHASIYTSYNQEILIDKIINLIPDNIFLHYKKYEIKVGIESDYLGNINDADPLKESQFLTKRDHTPPNKYQQPESAEQIRPAGKY
jgi:hypothetical protein